MNKHQLPKLFTAAALAISFGIIILAAVDDANSTKENPNVGADTRRFVLVEVVEKPTLTEFGWSIWCDTETGVLYAEKGADRGGITVLLDADGKPLLYEEENDG